MKDMHQYECHYPGEMHVNMNSGSHAFIGDSARMRHETVVKAKVIDSTARTERHNNAPERPDVTKNFSRLPKSHWVPQPNNMGEIRAKPVLNKASSKGIFKGGL